MAQTTLQLSTQRIAEGLDSPLFVTSPPNDPNRLFVIEQKSGAIKILDLTTGTVNPTPFLTLPAADLLKNGFEQGFLGLAFHPNYATNGKFYVSYTAPGGGNAGQTKVVEYRVRKTDPNQANPNSARLIRTINQPQENHNGGWLAFGPDGYLYWSRGDGGGSGFQPGIPDESDNAQDITNNLRGKILRLDINGDDFPDNPNRNYAIPPTNPFVGKQGDDEIWAYGLRNPWRPSFDRLTGDLYIADVGQSEREEINFQPASYGGANYGWNLKEGTLDYKPGTIPPNLTAPIYEYDHGVGQSIVGGYVYRGPVAALSGTYFFGDFISSQLFSFRYSNGGVTNFKNRTTQLQPSVGSINNVASFGEDTAGNLYIVDLDGEIYRLVVEVTSVGDGSSNSFIGGPDDDTLSGSAGDDFLDGRGGSDTLRGGTGNDILQGKGDTDQMSGGKGRDLLSGGGDSDTLNGNDGQDSLLGDGGNDSLAGDAGSDSLIGGAGNDTLVGGAGDDTLVGGVGNKSIDTIDFLTGEQGSDTFVLGTKAIVHYNDGDDSQPGLADYAVLVDFNSAEDVIKLKGSASRYGLDDVSIDGITGTGIYLDTNRNESLDNTDELIAIAQNSTGLSLTANYFRYV